MIIQAQNSKRKVQSYSAKLKAKKENFALRFKL